MTYFDNITQILRILKENRVNYLILRNYENLLDEGIYVSGHEDIDILCEDSNSIIQLLGALSNRKAPDLTHYHVFVNNNRVNLDLRHIGDGYYCEKWQRDMLQRRVEIDGFYIMNDEDYFYSLIYHAIFQKIKFSEEYRQRLEQMSVDILGKKISDETNFITELEQYMYKNGYKYTYTSDVSVPNRFSIVLKRELISHNIFLSFGHSFFCFKVALLEYAASIKHRIFK